VTATSTAVRASSFLRKSANCWMTGRMTFLLLRDTGSRHCGSVAHERGCAKEGAQRSAETRSYTVFPLLCIPQRREQFQKRSPATWLLTEANTGTRSLRTLTAWALPPQVRRSGSCVEDLSYDSRIQKFKVSHLTPSRT
jgi:hypothetical protein